MATATIILLGGCFWGLEYAVGAISGTVTEAGYAGGESGKSPTYYNLKQTGDAEAVRVTCDESCFPEVLKIFSERSASDPSPPDDPRYRRAVICPDEAFRQVAGLLADSGIPVLREGRFIPAEAFHQKKYEMDIGR